MTKRFYTYSELCLHNNPDDLWVSFLGRVYDLTPLSSEFRGIYYPIFLYIPGVCLNLIWTLIM